MKKFATIAASAALFAAALLPALANGGNDCTNFTTGPFSTNYCNISNESEIEVKNVNDAKIVNDVDLNVNTGNNTASFNTLGGSIDTGDADLSATIHNVANVNTVTVDVGSSGSGNTGANEITGPFSDNRVEIENEHEVEVENSNTAEVKNDIDVDVNTGYNNADYNTGPGEVRSGDAQLWLSVKNHVNDNLVEVDSGSNGHGGNSALNDTTGPFSTNYVEIENESEVEVKNVNDLVIKNFIDAFTNTGFNTASFNTLGGDVESGDADAGIEVENTGNINTVSVALALGGWGNEASNVLTGPYADNRTEIENEQEIEIENWNNKCESHNADRLGEHHRWWGNEWDEGGWTENNLKDHKCDPNHLGVFNFDDDVVDTGYNEADYNTGGGELTTGLAQLWKKITTHLNDTLVLIDP